MVPANPKIGSSECSKNTTSRNRQQTKQQQHQSQRNRSCSSKIQVFPIGLKLGGIGNGSCLLPKERRYWCLLEHNLHTKDHYVNISSDDHVLSAIS